jgi:ATP-dependent Lhr-like helicase
MTQRPPHILVTTPESLFILMTSEGGRRMLQTARTAIVDEIHAVAGTKRGAHLALTLERLEALAGDGLLRIGLSATQKPVEEVARFLVGGHRVSRDGVPACEIVDEGHRRDLDLAIEVPRSPLEAVMSTEVWGEVYDRIAELIGAHRTTLVFVNTRRLAERVTRYLGERLGEERVAAHHGSLSRDRRFDAEQRLKAGELSALVATASLELGIDIGSVDLVCQIGSTRSIATLLQRVGRSGHALAKLPKGRIFPLSRDELVEAAGTRRGGPAGRPRAARDPAAALDILSQQIVATVASEEWGEDALYALVRRAWPYRNLEKADFDAVVRMLAEGFHTRRGRRSSLVHHDEVQGRIRGRRASRIAAITSGGAIPDTADYHVVLEPQGSRVGTVNEDFAIESQAGDIFQLGNLSWKILQVEQGRLLVEDGKARCRRSRAGWVRRRAGKRGGCRRAAFPPLSPAWSAWSATSTAPTDPVAAITRELPPSRPGARTDRRVLGLRVGGAFRASDPGHADPRAVLRRTGDMHLVLHARSGAA